LCTDPCLITPLRRRDEEDDETEPIISRGERFWIEYERRLRLLRQPPPNFEEALLSSRPVSYIDVEDEPPPTYEDFLKSSSPLDAEKVDSFEGYTNPASSEGGGGISPFDDDFLPPMVDNSSTGEEIALRTSSSMSIRS